MLSTLEFPFARKMWVCVCAYLARASVSLWGARMPASKWDLSVLSPSVRMCVCASGVARASAVISMLFGSQCVVSMLSGS